MSVTKIHQTHSADVESFAFTAQNAEQAKTPATRPVASKAR